jgi:hypothetical protein
MKVSRARTCFLKFIVTSIKRKRRGYAEHFRAFDETKIALRAKKKREAAGLALRMALASFKAQWL